MTDIFDFVSEMNPSALKADGFDDCVLGILERFGMEAILVYDRSKVIAKLVSDGMTEDEAEEYFEYNIIGAWVGDGTPGFVTLVPQGSEQDDNAIS